MYAISNSAMDVLERPFVKMGARVRFDKAETLPFSRTTRPISLDVRHDRLGEYFLVRKRPEVSIQVLEVQPRDRHLVLMARVPEANGTETKSRFLLGHDERHWFVAAVPEQRPVSTVREAKQALKPLDVVRGEREIRQKLRDRRHNKARLRQGEWFFVPVKRLRVENWLVRKQEPLVRGNGSKPHICQELHRLGGETVYVHRRYPRGLSQAAFARLSEGVRSQAGWRTMVRNPRVFVRGTVRHPDHKTIVLEGWHEVFMNTENRAAAMRHVVFLD